MKVRRALIAGLLAGFAAVAPSLARAEAPRRVEADRATLERVLAENEVAREFASTGWLESFGYYLQRLTEALESLISGGGRILLVQAPLWIAALVLLLGCAAVLLVSQLVRRWRRRQAAEAGIALEIVALAPPAAAAAVWRRRAEHHLESGELTAALEAIWWWLASVLAAGAVDPSWTGRELLRRSRRPDLLSEVRQLDAFRFGRGAPAIDDVRRYLERLSGALA